MGTGFLIAETEPSQTSRRWEGVLGGGDEWVRGGEEEGLEMEGWEEPEDDEMSVASDVIAVAVPADQDGGDDDDDDNDNDNQAGFVPYTPFFFPSPRSDAVFDPLSFDNSDDEPMDLDEPEPAPAPPPTRAQIQYHQAQYQFHLGRRWLLVQHQQALAFWRAQAEEQSAAAWWDGFRRFQAAQGAWVPPPPPPGQPPRDGTPPPPPPPEEDE